MALSLRQAIASALAELGSDRPVGVSPALRAAAACDDLLPRANGAAPEVELILVRALGPNGELPLEVRASATELWAFIAPESAGAPFDASLESPSARRVDRVYHPLAVATIGADEGLVLRRLVQGVSARDVARCFGVRCLAGPDLAPWLPPS